MPQPTNIPPASSLLFGRREVLRAGCGLAIGSSFLPQAVAATAPAKRAKSCILIYLLGGPPQLDTFDLKPHAPAEVRGSFQPIATAVPGLEICEHLPRLAQHADDYALIRSVSYPNSNHTPMIYYTLTGRPTALPEQDNDVRPPQRDDFPHTGSVIAKFLSGDNPMPGYIAIPELATRTSTSGEFKRGAKLPLRGGSAGFLGTRFDPLLVNGEPGTPEAVPALSMPTELRAERFEKRSALLSLLDGKGGGRSQDLYGLFRDQAVLLTGTSQRSRSEAFRLDKEPDTQQLRYGKHRFGRSLLLARRLAEAGVPMISIHYNEMTVCDGWDTHTKNFEGLQQELLPMLDQSLSALMEDLEQRGLLDETLIVCMGEFGRTPKINKDAGRDHWGPCSSVLMAGGGIRGGRVWGASDKIAAYPIADKVDPVDIQATIYHQLGLNPHHTITDLTARPWEISTGRVLTDLLT